MTKLPSEVSILQADHLVLFKIEVVFLTGGIAASQGDAEVGPHDELGIQNDRV